MLKSGKEYFLMSCCLIVLLLVVSTIGNVAHAQSSDPASPAPLSSNPFNGIIKAKDNASYYYTFTAGPGNVTISVAVRTIGNLSQISIELSDSANSLLAGFDATSSGITQERKISLSSRQKLLLKITGLSMNDGGSFSVKLKGPVSFDTAPFIEPANRPNANTSTSPRTKDTTPPRIIITSPATNRGQGANTGGSRITVRGNAIDESGVSEVIVRGQPARLDASGGFSAEVMLKVGDNQIIVSATDIHGNQAEEKFAINRAAADSPATADQPATEPIKGRYYALLIAVQDYKSRSFPVLYNPMKDAEKLRDVLTTSYTFDKRDVRLLRDPTRDDIISAFEQLEKSLKAEDNLLIFYAGHGQWDKDRQQGYWIPSDVEGDSRSKWLSNGEVRDSIRGIKARHTLLITDACFSGGILSTRSAVVPASIEELMRLPSRTAMTSGAMSAVPDRSVFLEYLTNHLCENKETYKTAAAIFTSLQTAVIDNSPRMDDGKRTTPQYGTIQESGHEGGDFVFIKRGATLPPPPPMQEDVEPPVTPSPEDSYWDGIKNSEVVEDYRAYLKKYPSGKYVAEASKKIREIEMRGQQEPQINFELIEVGRSKTGSIAENQQKEYKFEGVANVALLFSFQKEVIRRYTTRYVAEIYDARGQKLKRAMVYVVKGHEISFTPPTDGQYIIRLTGENGYCSYTIHLSKL